MTSKKTTIDFGNVFVLGPNDARRLSQEMEKAVQVNGDTIIAEGAYKHRHHGGSEKQMQLRVTVELVEG